MGSSTSSPVNQTDSSVSTVLNNEGVGQGEPGVKSSRPPGCPLHNKGNDLKPAEVSQCPVSGKLKEEQASQRKFTISDCPIHAGKLNENKENSDMNELNPTNMVTFLVQCCRI